jgi:hypothetical protein
MLPKNYLVKLLRVAVAQLHWLQLAQPDEGVEEAGIEEEAAVMLRLRQTLMILTVLMVQHRHPTY